ncbi:AAA family ATPase [Corynebacterium bouchesdurhonense]|uniref:AAA family ATPase n=1 Tax=Corynebacterium bouchesdurhonense TaxID=1720192 RepID=UPI00082CBE65|nr:AAA family ATPase [Corynebacterium bouchesdurhonense]
MRIHALTIDNFRGIEHLELANLPDTGVIIIHGCNEAGKSTILDAIDTVLRERHTAGGKKMKIYAPAGKDTGPEVTLSATVGQYSFTIHKRWLKAKLAELTVTAPVRRNLTGREADDELERILAEQMDTSLATTLFLRQGALEPGIAAAGIPSISKALDAQAGGEQAGEEDTALMQAIEAEYARYFTAAEPPKEKASYKALFTAVDEAREECSRHAQEVERLAGFVEEVERKRAEIEAIGEELPQAQEELRVRQAEHEAAGQVVAKSEQARERLALATVTRERAEQDVAARAALRDRAEEAAEQEQQLQGKLGPATEARDAEAEKIGELTRAVEDAKRHLGAAREGVKVAEARRERVRAQHRLRVVDEQLQRIAAAEDAYAELLRRAPEREVSDKDVRALEQAENQVTLQRRLRDAASAKLEITAAGQTAVVEGEQLLIDGTEAVPVFEGTTLTLGDFAVVFRAAQGAGDPREAVERAEGELAALLEEAGCDTVAAARDARDACTAHAAEVKAARQRREDALAGAGADADELRAERDRLAAAAETAGNAEQPSEAETEQTLKEAQQALAAAERDVEVAEAALKPYSEKTAAHELTVLQTRLEAKAAQAQAAASELAKAAEAAAAADLDAAVVAAQAAEQEARAAVEALDADLAKADPELAQQLLEGAAARLANLEARRAEAQNRVAELSGHIDLAAGAAERADRAEAELDAAETELARATRRAEAAKLLWQTMRAHRDAARARYAAPFNEAIRNRARTLFGPSVDFNLGEDLTISERTVDGVTVPLTELSGGTREQLAILTRFAIADVVTDSGSTTPVPVVVDDALGATDPERLSRMNALFSQVGKNAQVLVLTCFPQRFDRVAAARTYSMDELKAARGA